VVVAVIAVRVVQVTADQVVDVRSVRDRLMTAVRSVLMSGAVLGGLVAERQRGWRRCASA
jgi:hypothetical protein